MESVLIFTHNVLCVAAVFSGTIAVTDLLARRLCRRRIVLFLRCSLGSNIAALLFALHSQLPSQKVAMVAVYGAGVAILAWRKFHLQGLWRSAFAFSLVVVLYLNMVALSIQMFGQDGLLFSMESTLFRNSQLVLLAVFLTLSAVAAVRFAEVSSPQWLRWNFSRLKRTGSHQHLPR